MRIRNSDGTWRNASFIRKRNASGGWDTLWTAAFTSTPSSLYVSGLRGRTLTGSVVLSQTATGTGWVAGGSGISVTGSGTNYTFSSSTTAGQASITRSGTYRFTATDGRTVDVPVQFDHIGSA